MSSVGFMVRAAFQLFYSFQCLGVFVCLFVSPLTQLMCRSHLAISGFVSEKILPCMAIDLVYSWEEGQQPPVSILNQSPHACFRNKGPEVILIF